MNSEKSVILGAGLIAKSLSHVDFGRPTLVLASGVSNSLETRPEAFKREADLVEESITNHRNLHVVYCSTCSVDSGVQTPYIVHKLQMEEQVLSKAISCHVFRLPQVVGLVRNRTLVSYFVESILRNRVLKVQTRATRNLLDVHDFARVASLAVHRNAGAGVAQNIASSMQVPVIDIVDHITQLLGRPARIERVDAGYRQVIDTEFLQRLLPADDPLFDPEYWRRVLQHYVPLIAADFANAEMSL